MKNYLMLFIILLSGIPGLRAQETDWSESQPFKSKTSYNVIVGETEDGIYLIRSRDRDMTTKPILEKYSSSLTLIYSRPLEGLKKGDLIGAMIIHDTLRIFKKVYDRPTTSYHIFMYSLDPLGTPVADEKKIAENKEKYFGDEGDFILMRSDDGNRIFLHYTSIGAGSKMNVTIDVFNTDLERLRHQNFELDFEHAKGKLTDMKADNNGNLYFTFEIDNRKKTRNEHLYRLQSLYLFDFETSELEEIVLNDESYSMREPRININYHTGTVTCTGFYSNEKKAMANGVYVMKASAKTHEKEDAYVVPFPKELLVNLIGEKSTEARPGLYNYYLKYIVPMSDGGLLISAEEFFITTQTSPQTVNGMPIQSNRDVYNYGKIFLLSLANDGTVRWTKTINKVQITIQDQGYYSSFSMLPDSAGIRIIYNDLDRVSSNVNMYVFSPHGEIIQSKVLFKNTTNKVAIVSSEILQSHLNSAIIPTEKDKKFALLRITF